MSTKKVRNNVQKSRKQRRKEERKNKKIRRNEYYSNRKKPGQYVLIKKSKGESAENQQRTKFIKHEPEDKNKKKKHNVIVNKQLSAEEMREKEKKKQVKLQKEMNKHRSKQLQEANLEEDRNIKRLEKQLKLNKRKSKSVPASFVNDGLDYLLEVCDPENLKSSALAEQQLAEVNDEFGEDVNLMAGGERSELNLSSEEDSLYSGDDILSSDEEFDDVIEDKHDAIAPVKRKIDNSGSDKKRLRKDSENSDKSVLSSQKEGSCDSENESTDNLDGFGSGINSDNNVVEEETENVTWEDIYGRLRSKDGSVITEESSKYVPPAARGITYDTSTDKIQMQKFEKLRKQLKGLINRLAESNLHNITTQIEELYMNNSRNTMNSTITSLVLDALVSNVLTPERLLMEHVLLIIILHANVGTEVGAHFLQTVVKQFDENLKSTKDIENKRLDNIIKILAHLYNFKLFDSKLIYEIIEKLCQNFEEKNVECILHILKSVGFSLRKDNPLALKNLILSLQKRAFEASEELKNNSRVKFMLDILLAIKNNNVTKIPNYDTSYSEHLKKIMKSFIRKGNHISQLNISLEDLLKAEEKGKWWVIGSAWVGNSTENESHTKNTENKLNSFSQNLLELAVKQRMNTDTRKNIFCIIMSAEDYLDAFEKLLRLALKNQQEREIINVILHCCLQEKTYNPYYATLAQKFCEYDRKYQMTIKYSIWDKLKALQEHSATQISNLAKLLGHLFIEKGLPISVLKIVQFSELDKITLRFIRQILLGILLQDEIEVCKGVFEKVCQSDKLKMFRESLRLFLYHFLLKNLESQGIPDDKKEMLKQRIKLVEKLLTGKEAKFRI